MGATKRRRSSFTTQLERSVWFLAHHRAEAFLHARSLQTWLATLLKEPAFVSDENGAGEARGL